jgi:large subunit ribosomal protein L25
METITAQKRELKGKKVQNLRNQGLLPAVLYGKGKSTESISVNAIEFSKLWKNAGESSIVELKMQDGKENVLINDVARDPLSGNPIHADFYIVDMTKSVEVAIKLNFIGESPVEKAGGILIKVMHELNIEALPTNLPHELVVDLSLLKDIDHPLKVSDIPVPDGVTILAEQNETVALGEERKKEEELDEEEAKSLDDIEVVGDKKEEKEEDSDTNGEDSSKSEK